MAGVTLDQAETQLADYLAAEQAVLSNQAYTIAGRSMTRANLKDIRDGIDYWDAKVKALNARASGRSRAVTVSPSR